MIPLLARPRRLALALAALVSASTAICGACGGGGSGGLEVDVSLVVHTNATFSAMLTLPPSLAKKGNVEAQVSVVDGNGSGGVGQSLLVKQKLSVSAGGEVHMHHELRGLRLG